MLADLWQYGKFTREARRASALKLLQLWREDGSYFGADDNIQAVSELAYRHDEQKVETTLDDLQNLTADGDRSNTVAPGR